MQTQLKNFIHLQLALKDKILDEILNSLKDNIKSIKEKIHLIAYELLKTFIPQTETIIKESKGIGKDLALKLFSHMHFNKDKNDKQIISFIGLSPRIYQSGSSIKANPHINKRGDNSIRKALFLSAMVCIRYNDKFKEKYNNLISKGKSKKVAIVAVMCAIIRYLKTYFRFELPKVA